MHAYTHAPGILRGQVPQEEVDVRGEEVAQGEAGAGGLELRHGVVLGQVVALAHHLAVQLLGRARQGLQPALWVVGRDGFGWGRDGGGSTDWTRRPHQLIKQSTTARQTPTHLDGLGARALDALEELAAALEEDGLRGGLGAHLWKGHVPEDGLSRGVSCEHV